MGNLSPQQDSVDPPFLVSKRLAILAFILWLVSLGCTGLVFYQETISGIEILLMGWLGPLALNLAWYANPFFLFACFKLSTGGQAATWASVIAILLAADTFRFRELLLNEGGTTTDLYGYGIGSLLWLVVILFVLVIEGVRLLEERGRPLSISTLIKQPLVLLGSFLLLVLLSLSGYWGINDRVTAGESERKYLADVVFKVGSVCRVRDVKPLARIRLTGPLELMEPANAYLTAISSPTSLLSWGIPVVRKDGFDFYLRDKNASSTIVARPASGPTAARLETEHTYEPKQRTIRARLTAVGDSTVGFDSVWIAEPGSRYCPGYFRLPEQDQPPRSLLLDTLVSEEGTAFDAVPYGSDTFDGLEIEKLQTVRVSRVRTVHRHEIKDNMGCPGENGIRNVSMGMRKKLDHVWSRFFQIGEQLHYLQSSHTLEAVCSKDHVYLSHSFQGRVIKDRKEDWIYLQKRSFPGFQNTWQKKKSIVIDRGEAGLSFDRMDIKVQSVQVREGKLQLTLAYFLKDSDVGEIVEVEALLDTS
jgi:hypothetical protein